MRKAVVGTYLSRVGVPLYLCSAFCATLCICSMPPVAAVEMQTILTNMRAAEENLDSFKCRFTISSHNYSLALGSKEGFFEPEEAYEYTMLVSGDRFRLSGEMKATKEDKAAGRIPLTVVGNNLSTTQYLPDTNQAAIHPATTISVFSFETVLHYNLCMGGGRLTDFVAAQSPVSDGTEKCGQSECFSIRFQTADSAGSVFSTAKMLVDPNRGWRVVYEEVFDATGNLWGTSEVEFKEWEPEIWFPISGKKAYFDKAGQVERECSLSVHEFEKIKGVAEETAFVIDLPAGTLVYDAITGLEYTTPGKGEVGQ